MVWLPIIQRWKNTKLGIIWHIFAFWPYCKNIFARNHNFLLILGTYLGTRSITRLEYRGEGEIHGDSPYPLDLKRAISDST